MSEIETGQVTPEAPPVEAQSTPAPEVTATPESEVTPEQTQERVFKQQEVDDIVQKRLAKESRRLQKLADAQAEAAYWRRQAEQGQPKPAEQPTGKPVSSQFQDYEAYTEALAEWKVDQKLKALQTETEAERTRRAQAEQSSHVSEKLSKGFEEYADFEDVALAPDVPITQAMAAAIAESDIAHKLSYHLGSNRAEAARISKMTPGGQFRAVLELEAKLKAPAKPTQTPPPIVPNAATAPTKKDPFDFDPGNKAAWKKFQLERSKARASR